MVSKIFSVTAVAALASVATAQTFTDCNPLKKTCPADSAFGKNSVNCQWTSGSCSAFSTADGTALTYGSNGAVFKIESETDAPTIKTGKYIFFGRIDVEVQAAAGQGIVTSAVLQSDDLDEIDWEWVGGDNAQAQTNYFSKGDTSTYDRGAYHPVANPTGQFHTYSVEWTPTEINWIIDGSTVRTLLAANAHGADGFPQTPMQVKLGTWVAGRKDAPKGTVQWAGGYTDFSKAPFMGYYKSISIVDYAGKSGPTSDSVKEYIYGDETGSASSIKVVGGSGGDDTNSSSASGSASQTATKVGSHTKTASGSTTTDSSDKSSKTSDSSASATTDGASGTGVGIDTSATPTTMATASGSGSSSGSSTSSGSAPASTTHKTSDAAHGVMAAGGLLLASFVMVAQLL